MCTTFQQLSEYIKDEGIVNVDFKTSDLRGRWRHLTIPAVTFTKDLLTFGFGFDASNYGFKKVSESDMIMIPDPSTFFIDPFWELPTISLICNIHETGGNEPRFEADPRFICQKAQEAFYALGIGDELLLGPEYEFYIFDNIRYAEDGTRSYFLINEGEENPHGIDQSGYHMEQPKDRYASFRAEVCKILIDMGIAVKYHHYEVGFPGQSEIETSMGTPLVMADNSMKIKYVLANNAAKWGFSTTFMPKPIYGAPGNGFHVHFKLNDHGKPVFYDPDGYSQLSKTALSFIIGVLLHAPAITAFANPSTNSFKRLVPGYEAPIYPVYGTGNRSAAIRIPGYVKAPEDKRFEYRTGDLTANPYLMFSALIMAGYDGIRRGLDPANYNVGPYDVNLFELPQEEKESITALPTSLPAALDALEKDNEFLTYADVFNSTLIENWINIKRKEAAEVALYPTPKEYELYYEC